MKTSIVPIVKDKTGILTDKNNYRPIAITSVMSKIFELLLLDHLHYNVQTCDNQFGFKKKHGTDMCIFSLKHVVDFYRQRSSPVYICFLDASKAFDRINHWSLFAKLIKRNVHVMIVRILLYWYRNQLFCIRWGSQYSGCFAATNGVRQGGVLSPALFNCYMDDLSNVLLQSKLGCNINGLYVNHLMYADDTCLIAPSPGALTVPPQSLFRIC